MKLKKGDTVKVLIGKDKGKEGTVEKIFRKAQSVLIPGVNEFKRHVKSREKNTASRQGGQKSEIITITKPLLAANVALVCPRCKKPTRIGYKILNNLPAGKAGKKVRICRKCGKAID